MSLPAVAGMNFFSVPVAMTTPSTQIGSTPEKGAKKTSRPKQSGGNLAEFILCLL